MRTCSTPFARSPLPTRNWPAKRPIRIRAPAVHRRGVKRRGLERHLQTHDCREVGGSKHAKWRGPQDHVSAVLQHREIGPGLVRAICNQLRVPQPTTLRIGSRIKESNEMRPLRYSINVTLDGCCHHEAGIPPDEESMRYWTAEIERADALLFGRVTYEMMESAWRQPATGTWPDWMDEWEIPFAEAIDRAKKYVVSSTLSGVDWNAELVRGDLGQAVQRLKQEPGESLWVGGVTLPLALADLGLIDEYEFLVQPILAGHGPTLLAGLRERIQLELVDRDEFRSGAVALRYRPTRVTA